MIQFDYDFQIGWNHQLDNHALEKISLRYLLFKIYMAFVWYFFIQKSGPSNSFKIHHHHQKWSTFLGGGFIFFQFSPLGLDDPIWLIDVFQMGWEKKPTN